MTVGKYDATTGKVINDSFVTMPGGPYSVALSGNTLFVATFPGSTLGVYNITTGQVINANFITGLNSPFGIAFKGRPPVKSP